jgi:CDP-diacylglycerol--glycerol-3-phosphate 3-phosphatidyltransferase
MCACSPGSPGVGELVGMINLPNTITIARILLVAPFVICLLNLQDPGWPWARPAALALFAAMAISDVADGQLARRRNQVTSLGKFLDPVADKLLVTCAVILLGMPTIGVPGFILPNWVVVLAVGKDLIVVIGFLLIYLAVGRIFISPSLPGKACTVCQLILVVAVLLGPNLPGVARYLPTGLWWIASGLAGVAAINYVRIGQRYVAKVEARAAESPQQIS